MKNTRCGGVYVKHSLPCPKAAEIQRLEEELTAWRQYVEGLFTSATPKLIRSTTTGAVSILLMENEPLCGARGMAGGSGCILPAGHTGNHAYKG